MAVYTYLFHDLLSGEALAELPLTGVTFGRELGGVGTFTGTLKGLGTRRIRRLDPMAATQTRRTALYVDRDGTLVWGGVVWGRRGTDTLELTAEEFRSYWRRRRIRWDLTYADADQGVVLCDLLERAAAEPAGDIGLLLPANRTTGVARTVSYAGAERKVLEEAWGELEGMAGAFETSVEVSYGEAGRPVKRLTWGLPLGHNRGLVVEKPGNLLDHGGWPEDGSGVASRVTAIGGQPEPDPATPDTQPPPLLAESYHPQPGVPLLEDVTTYTDLAKASELPLLVAHAEWDQLVASAPAELPELLISGDDPPLGSYRPGDAMRVRVTDQRFPRPDAGGPGLDTTLRVLGFEVSPPADSRETVKVTVGTTGQLARRSSYRRRLRALERRLGKLEARGR